MNQTEDGLYLQKGFLKEDFLFFHLKDQQSLTIETYYHDFHKLVLFYAGEVTYAIEGKYYKLRPGDILFIANHALHKPIISTSSPYERIILWINPSYALTSEYDLLGCFEMITGDMSHLLRPSPENKIHLHYLFSAFEKAQKDTAPGHTVLQDACFNQLLVWLNRYLKEPMSPTLTPDIHYEPRIQTLIDYINSHLTEDLSIDHLAAQSYLSKHYLMHFFKNHTGYSLHQYIQKKRLIKASHLLQQDRSISSICTDCGFTDYSNFSRAFKKEFNRSPKQYQLENQHAYPTL